MSNKYTLISSNDHVIIEKSNKILIHINYQIYITQLN
jgi:hypothetical protein